MAYYSKYTGAELEEKLDKIEEIPQLIAQMITGKDFVTKEDLLCVLRDYAPATYATIPIDNNTIYWENGVLKSAGGGGSGDCQWELREHNGVQYLFSRLPVVTQYDVTMYADVNRLDLPNIYDGLPIDGDTIYWEETEEGRVLKAKFNGDVGVDASEVLSIVYNAGYATKKWVNNQNFVTNSFLASELSKYVSLGEEYQEIIGVKNFLNGLQIGGIPIYKHSNYEDVIYIDGNVVIRGGLTMYYDNGEIDLPTIKDEIGLAGYDGAIGLASFNSSQFSISSDGTVTIIGGSTGLDTAQLAEYLTTNKYVTQGWVTSQGYASASNLTALQSKVDNFLEGSDSDTIINKWLELEAFLSGLSESDNLATILSNKANKATTLAGYGITDAYTKTQVDNTFKLYIPIAGYTEITGEKNFTGGLRVNNSPVIYYDEANKYWKLEGDLLVTGGVTMYGVDEGDLPSILDSLPIASTTAPGIAKYDSNYFSVNSDGLVTLINAPSSGATSGLLGSFLLNVDDSVDTTPSVDRVLYQPAGSDMWTWKALSEIGGGSSGGGGSVSGEYLPLNMTSTPFVTNSQVRVANFKSTNAYEVGIGLFIGSKDRGSIYASNSSIGIWNKTRNTSLYLKDDGGLRYEIDGVEHAVLNGGNYSNYALPLSGGTLTGDLATSNGGRLFLNAGGEGIYIYNEGISFHSSYNNWVASNMAFYSDGSVSLCPIGGNVGIGTTSPQAKLEINGGLGVTGYTWLQQLGEGYTLGSSRNSAYLPSGTVMYVGSLDNNVSSASLINFDTKAINGGTNGVFIGGVDSGLSNKASNFVIGRRTGTSTWAESLRIDANGNVGIGTTSPAYKLDVNGSIGVTNNNGWALTSQTSASLFCGAHSGGYGVYIGTTNTSSSVYALRVGGSLTGASNIFFTVNANGNVGIGTTSPLYPLHVLGTTFLQGKTAIHEYATFEWQTGGANPEYASRIGSFDRKGGFVIQFGKQTESWAKCFSIIDHEWTKTLFEVDYNGNARTEGELKTLGLYLTGYGSGTFTIAQIGSNSQGLYVEAPWYNESLAYKLPITISWRGGFNNQGGMKLDASANLLVTGGVTMYSDARKKTKLQDVELSLSQIANAPLIQHYYNSDQDKTTHVGSIAQYWYGMNDWFCKEDNEGYLTMEIQNCALASAISIARELDRYETKTDKTIRKMKQRIAELEDEVERLKNN